MMPESRPFHAYIEPARTRGGWGRVLLGLIVIVVVWFGLGLALVEAVWSGLLLPLGLGPEAMNGLYGDSRLMSPPGIVVFLLTFFGLWLGVWLAVRGVHWRSFGTVFGPDGIMNRRDMLRGAGLSVGFMAVSLITYLLVLGPPQRTELALGVWAVWIVPIVLCIGIQASAEEVLFRGYILQSLAVWSRNPIVWAIIPAVVFTALHYDSEMDSGMRWRMLVHILLIGLITAALVWRTGNLGAAVGLHVANNILAIGGAGIEGSALGFELWVFPPDTLHRMFVFDLALGLLMFAAVFILFRPEGEA